MWRGFGNNNPQDTSISGPSPSDLGRPRPQREPCGLAALRAARIPGLRELGLEPVHCKEGDPCVPGQGPSVWGRFAIPSLTLPPSRVPGKPPL